MTQEQNDLLTKIIVSTKKNPITKEDFYAIFPTFSEVVSLAKTINLELFGVKCEVSAKSVVIETPKTDYIIAAHPVGSGYVIDIR